MLADCRDRLPQGGRPSCWGPWMMLAGVLEGLVVLGERKEAAAFYGAVAYAIDAGAVSVNYHDGRLLERLAGMAASAGRRWDEAEAHFRNALRLADELPNRIEALETRRFYGQMLLDRNEPGDREPAVRLLNEASAGFGRLGMPRHAELAEADRHREP